MSLLGSVYFFSFEVPSTTAEELEEEKSERRHRAHLDTRKRQDS